jgi:hypothetical protein
LPSWPEIAPLKCWPKDPPARMLALGADGAKFSQ